MTPFLIDLIYLIASGLMLAGIWQFLKPGRAQQGNLLVGAGILLAVLATLAAGGLISIGAALLGLAVGIGCGALVGLRTNAENALPRLALLVSGLGLASALVAGAMIHNIGAQYEHLVAEQRKAWEGIPESVRQVNATLDFELGIPWTESIAAAIAAAFGGMIATAGVISFLKLSKSRLRKALPKLEEPRMPQIGLAVVCVLFGVLLVAWPGTETFLWLLLIAAMALGYLLTIHLKIVDVPPVLAACVSAAGLSLAAAGLVIGNILMVTAGGLVAAGGAAVAQSLCRSLNVSLVGLIRGSESSKTGAEDVELTQSAPRGPAPLPGPATATADPDAPIL